jgi:hypothetical protein
MSDEQRKVTASKVQDYVGLAVGVAGLLGLLAGAIQSLIHDLSAAVPFVIAAAPLLVIFFAWLGWHKISRYYSFGRACYQFLAQTEEQRKRFTQEKITELYSRSAQPNAEILWTIGQMVAAAKSSFQGNKTVLDVVGGVEACLEQIREPIRIRKSLHVFMKITEQLRKEISEGALLQLAKDPENRTERIQNSIQNILDSLTSAFDALTGGKTVVSVFKTIHPTSTEILNCLHSRLVTDNRRLNEPTIRRVGSLAGHVLETASPLFFSSLDDDRISGKFLADTWSNRAKFIQSGIIVPVIVNGKTAGTLGVDCNEANIFKEDWLSLVTYAADSVGSLIQVAGYVNYSNGHLADANGEGSRTRRGNAARG